MSRHELDQALVALERYGIDALVLGREANARALSGANLLWIFLVIALVVFGPKKLPDLGRSLGSGMREFKNSITEKS